jgi:hypothetical protein
VLSREEVKHGGGVCIVVCMYRRQEEERRRKVLASLASVHDLCVIPI